LGEHLLLPLGEAGDLHRESLLRALEVLAPPDQAPLDAPLGLGECLAEAAGRLLLPVGDLLPARLGDATPFLEEERRRLGPRPRRARGGSRGLRELVWRSRLAAPRRARRRRRPLPPRTRPGRSSRDPRHQSYGSRRRGARPARPRGRPRLRQAPSTPPRERV